MIQDAPCQARVLVGEITVWHGVDQVKTTDQQPVSLAANTGGGKSVTRLGRVAAPPVALPSIEDEAQVIADWLQEREGPQRRPEQTARVLALAVKLHLDGRRPWPVRRQVSEHTGVSLPMIDVIMSQRQASQDITVWTTTVMGNVKKHESIITQRFIQPSDELINVVQRDILRRTKDEKNAKRRERNAQRRKLDLMSLAPPAHHGEPGCEVCESKLVAAPSKND